MHENHIVIRPGRPEDGHVLAELMNIAGEGIPAFLWAHMAAPGEDAMAYGAHRVARTDGAFSFVHTRVAELAGQIAGMLLSYRLADPYQISDMDEYPPVVRPLVELEALAPGSWYINAIATSAACRGQGVATRLMLEAEDMARHANARELALIVAEENVSAKQLYEKMGYCTLARRPIVAIAGFAHQGDWILMQKLLNAP